MITDYQTMKRDIDELYAFLNKLSIDAAYKSHLEHDYFGAMVFLDDFRETTQGTAAARNALGGLHELKKWVWAVKDCPEFSEVIPHLKMLSESATRINSETPMISPVTGKQDDKTNKLIETIVGMFAIKVGTNVDMDDPVSSSGGTNPDVMFDYQGRRIAFACKTLRSRSARTVLDNLRSAAEQIDRSNCDAGYIALNAMNILPHSSVADVVFRHHWEPQSLLSRPIESLYGEIKREALDELAEIASLKKVRPVILTFAHSSTRLASSAGNISTMLKIMCMTEMIDGGASDDDKFLLRHVNEFIHNRL